MWPIHIQEDSTEAQVQQLYQPGSLQSHSSDHQVPRRDSMSWRGQLHQKFVMRSSSVSGRPAAPGRQGMHAQESGLLQQLEGHGWPSGRHKTRTREQMPRRHVHQTQRQARSGAQGKHSRPGAPARKQPWILPQIGRKGLILGRSGHSKRRLPAAWRQKGVPVQMLQQSSPCSRQQARAGGAGRTGRGSRQRHRSCSLAARAHPRSRRRCGSFGRGQRRPSRRP